MLPKILVTLGFLFYLSGFILPSVNLPRIRISWENVPHESSSYASSDQTLKQEELIVTLTPTPDLPIYYWPTRIIVKRAYIDLPITEGGIVDGEWILSDESALYLPTSQKIREGGNTIIYAHNRRGMFYYLKRVRVGDTVTITDESDNTYSYQVYSTQNIQPTAIEETETGAQNTLTIFTCDGWLDKERLIVKARIIES